MTQIRTGSSCRTSISGRSPRGTYVSTFNPNDGLPTTGSGASGAKLKGDFWDASLAGTISGLNIEDLEVGDLLVAKVNDASTASQFIVNKAEGSGGGSGDVVGPGSATDGAIALFDGATGKLIKNSAYTPSSFDAAGSAAAVQSLAALKANNLSDLASATTARTNLGLGTLATQSGTFTDKQNLVNAATALVDGATIDLTAIKHTLTTAASRTFTISYTGDDITLEITLNATSATFTLPSGDKGIYGGTPSGTNTLVVTGAISGDIILVAIKKIGTVHYWVGKNAIR